MGAKNLYLIVLFSVVLVSLISLASAEITLSQPNALYSMGDQISLDVKLDSVKTGYLEVNLVCPGTSQNIYQDVPASTTITISRPLTPAYVNNSHGECHFVANYAEESALSQSFQISTSIDVIASNSNLSYNAGDIINIRGTAYKANNQLVGQQYKGYVEVIMSDEIKVKAEIKDSQFDVNFKTPETTKRGDYVLTIRVTEEDSDGNVLNYGQTNFDVKINQVTAKIDIAMDRQSINPGDNITLIPYVYDKAGEVEEGKISLKIEDVNGHIIYSGAVDANQQVILETQTTNPPGNSKILAEKDGVNAERFFQITELKKVSAQIINKSLVITNIGNVAYSGIVQITIGGQIITKQVELGLGESKSYQMSAPDGVYDVSVSDGSNILSESGVSLTGNAISLSDTKNALNSLVSHYPIVWIFLILIIALFIWVYYKRYGESRKFGFIPSQSSSGSRISNIEKKRGGVEVVKPEVVTRKAEEAVFNNEVRKAEQVTVLHGQKQPASIIAVKIKNNMGGISKQSLNSALEYGYRRKAVSYSSGDYILLIFSPLLTKTMNNEETAVKTAIDIDNFLREHNRKFRNDTIVYGIGVNSGDIINKMGGKVLQFTSISNTINLAKRIAEVSNGDVLLSKQIHEKTVSNIRTEKFASGSMDLFTIKRVVDTEKSAKFIQGFLRRNNP